MLNYFSISGISQYYDPYHAQSVSECNQGEGRMVWYEYHGGFIGFGSWSLSSTMVLTADSLEGNLSSTLLQPSSESVEDWKSENVSSGTITAN